MQSLVLQLQQAALSKDDSIADLLRLALVVARKLKVTDLQKWIENELNGYTLAADIPPYRRLRGTLRAFNQFQGWQDVAFGSNEVADKFCIRPVMESVGALEALLKGVSADGQLSVTYSAEVISRLSQAMGPGWSQPTLIVSQASMSNILEAAKNAVLTWTLQLEEADILGEGLTFSSKEQLLAKEASASTVYTATHMTVVQSMNQSQIQQSSPGATQTFTIKTVDPTRLQAFVVDAQAYAKTLKLEPTAEAQLSADLATLGAQAKAPTPSTSIVSEALVSTRKILESAAGGLTAANLPALLQKAASIFS